MKILFVSPHYKPYLGGIERVIEKLAREFVTKFNASEIGVLTSKWSFPRRYHPDWKKIERYKISSFAEALKDRQNTLNQNEFGSGYARYKKETVGYEEVIRLSSWPSWTPSFFQVPLVWFSPWEIRKIIDKFQPDVIQLMSDRWFWVNFWVIFWARQKNIPVFFSLSFHQLTSLQSFLRPINAYYTRRVSKVQVITNHEKELVKQTYWTPAEKFVVIPWGIDKLQDTNHKIQKQDSLTILSVGRVSKHKGQWWLTKVYQQADFQHPTQLVLVGDIEDMDVAEEIRKLQMPFGKRIVLTGKVSDDELQNWYQKADIFALFPEYEAFGLVFLEAMVYGIPVLTHRVGALSEVLQQRVTIVNPYNQTQARDKLSKLVNDPEFRHNIGGEGRKYVIKHFSWEKTAQKFMEEYQQHLNN